MEANHGGSPLFLLFALTHSSFAYIPSSTKVGNSSNLKSTENTRNLDGQVTSKDLFTKTVISRNPCRIPLPQLRIGFFPVYFQSSLQALLATRTVITTIHCFKFLSIRILRALETRALCPHNLSILSVQVPAGDTAGVQ